MDKLELYNQAKEAYLSQDDKLSLYKQAKDAYYNGAPIMSDAEFDELERELGLENKGYIGSIRNPKYTVQHPYIMGSLSKVQVHKDRKTGEVDWASVLSDAKKYFGDNEVIITPKYDGCSFEMIFTYNENKSEWEFTSASTRGDGHFGKDIKDFVTYDADKILEIFNLIKPIPGHIYVLRGEILIDNFTFEDKYSEEFVNPRSFVAGTIGSDYDGQSNEFTARVSRLKKVIYYIAEIDKNGNCTEYDFIDKTNIIPKYLLPESDSYLIGKLDAPEFFRYVYTRFDYYRQMECPYTMDGFVIKPIAAHRKSNTTLERPDDCVAIKFCPMVAQTKVTNIEWNLGKSGEYIPNIQFEPVTMDGKVISKANGFNYDYCVQNNIVKDKIITISLAGDIIPYIYEIDPVHVEGELNIPQNSEVVGGHLMAVKTKEEKEEDELYYSILSLNIPGVGPEIAKAIVEEERRKVNVSPMLEEFFGHNEALEKFRTNILLFSPNVLEKYIGGKNGKKIATAFKKMLNLLTLEDIILACNFKQCGKASATQCANYISKKSYDFSGLSSEGYVWVKDENSPQYQKLMEILAYIKKPISSWVTESSNEVDERIPIIMTGEPNNYPTKKDFLKAHPEFRDTGSWKEVQIVFTNDMNSNTGKMKKAREKGIEIRIY